MKTEYEVYEEVRRLRKCVHLRKELLKSVTVDNESKSIYEVEIKEMQNDIDRLMWVLK